MSAPGRSRASITGSARRLRVASGAATRLDRTPRVLATPRRTVRMATLALAFASRNALAATAYRTKPIRLVDLGADPFPARPTSSPRSAKASS
jgi:hypothetical protein